jgi:hypothetical protein
MTAPKDNPNGVASNSEGMAGWLVPAYPGNGPPEPSNPVGVAQIRWLQ